MAKKNYIRIFISVIALFLIAIHFIWPSIKIDIVTLGLLIVALLPWCRLSD